MLGDLWQGTKDIFAGAYDGDVLFPRKGHSQFNMASPTACGTAGHLGKSNDEISAVKIVHVFLGEKCCMGVWNRINAVVVDEMCLIEPARGHNMPERFELSSVGQQFFTSSVSCGQINVHHALPFQMVLRVSRSAWFG